MPPSYFNKRNKENLVTGMAKLAFADDERTRESTDGGSKRKGEELQ
jgi:hypothetical protein